MQSHFLHYRRKSKGERARESEWAETGEENAQYVSIDDKMEKLSGSGWVIHLFSFVFWVRVAFSTLQFPFASFAAFASTCGRIEFHFSRFPRYPHVWIWFRGAHRSDLNCATRMCEFQQSKTESKLRQQASSTPINANITCYPLCSLHSVRIWGKRKMFTFNLSVEWTQLPARFLFYGPH